MLFRCGAPDFLRVGVNITDHPPHVRYAGGSKIRYFNSSGCTKVHSLSVGNRVYLKPARRNQVHLSVRRNRRNHATKKSNSKELLTISRRYAGKHESVGLHSTLEQEIRDYLAGARHPRKAVSGKQGAVQEISAGRADYSESAAPHEVAESGPHPISAWDWQPCVSRFRAKRAPEAGSKKITKRL